MRAAWRITFVHFLIGIALGKSELENPRDQKGSYAFAPHFARTLIDLNDYPPVPMADHSPITIDLPFQEPADLGVKGD